MNPMYPGGYSGPPKGRHREPKGQTRLQEGRGYGAEWTKRLRIPKRSFPSPLPYTSPTGGTDNTCARGTYRRGREIVRVVGGLRPSTSEGKRKTFL